MNAVQHSSNTRVLGAPRGWVQGELPVHALPITDAIAGDKVPTVLSFWKPDAEELAMLNAGGLVSLSVVGITMPPVAIFAVEADK
jgi:hypothetical protein